MTPNAPNSSEDLASAGETLRQVLIRLDGWAKSRVKFMKGGPHDAAAQRHVDDLNALMVAVGAYESAVEANMAPISHHPASVLLMTSAEVLAYRQADPVYQLGFNRGTERGKEQAAAPREKAISLYSEHANLAPPLDPSALVRRVKLIIAFQQSVRIDPEAATRPRLDQLRDDLRAASTPTN